MDLNFDIKGKVEEIVAKLKKDPDLMEKFQNDPIKALESVLGVDLPDEQLKPLVAGVKAKLTASDLGDQLAGLKKLIYGRIPATWKETPAPFWQGGGRFCAAAGFGPRAKPPGEAGGLTKLKCGSASEARRCSGAARGPCGRRARPDRSRRPP